jgi:hypothetical protein
MKLAEQTKLYRPRCTCHVWEKAMSTGWHSIYPPPQCPVHPDRWARVAEIRS